jgi:hypothetical protein
MNDQAERTRAKRSSVILKALVQSASAPAGVERRVRNLSNTGACVDHAGELSAGETVVLFMGEVADAVAHVMWATDRLAGLRFERDVDLEDARKHRTAAPTLRSGWMANMNHAYRRHG